MGDCKYCGKSAGFLRKQHKDCAEQHLKSTHSIKDLCVNAALHNGNLDALPLSMRAMAEAGYGELPDEDMPAALAIGWAAAVEAAMEDHSLSEAEKRGLNRYRARFDLDERLLNRDGHFNLFKMMVLLNTVTEKGIIPQLDRKTARAEHGHLPFNLMKSEQLVWLFEDVGYMQQVTRREFQGSSLGMSFRVAKGVYIRPGTFRGRSVATKSMERTDDGTLGITTKHIYFSGYEKRFRVRLEKIVSFEPYSDGLGIMRDTASAKPEIFLLDGNAAWFAINLIEAILDMEDTARTRENVPTLGEIVNDDLDDEDDAAGMFAAGASSGL